MRVKEYTEVNFPFRPGFSFFLMYAELGVGEARNPKMPIRENKKSTKSLLSLVTRLRKRKPINQKTFR